MMREVGAGRPAVENLRTTNAAGVAIGVTSISFDFDRIGEQAGTSDHGYLTFHDGDGSIQTLGGHTIEVGTDANSLAVVSDIDRPPLGGPARLTSDSSE